MDMVVQDRCTAAGNPGEVEGGEERLCERAGGAALSILPKCLVEIPEICLVKEKGFFH